MIDLMKTILLSVAIFVGAYLVMGLVTGTDMKVRGRLNKIKVDGGYNREQRDTRSFFDRLVKPFYDRMFNLFSRFTPDNVSDEYEELIAGAGLQKAYTSTQLVTNQILLLLVVTILTVYMMNSLLGKLNVLILLVIMISSIYLPILYLRQKGKQRKDRIQKSLPNLLDMVYISVEAGLSFDAAMTITARRTDNELADEIVRSMKEINRGRVREDALYSIADRTKVDDVRTFISTIIQSEKLGSNISNVLRIQADVIRDKRRQEAEEKINKMPIKMLLPLVFLLLPALFVVIMGPAVISFMQSSF